jgi:hypothetical protein
VSAPAKKAQPKLNVTVETITPDMAAQMLGTMKQNRRMRRATVQRYAREMATGHWQLNGEPIIFDHAGALRDGQHRLNAVVLAKVPVQMLVVRGVGDDAMATIDTGASRSFGDVITLRGGSSLGPQIGSIARMWWLYENTESLISAVRLSHQELDAVVELHPSIEAAATRAHRSHFKRHLPISVLGFTFSYLSERVDPEMAELYVSTIEKGANLDEDDPIFALRRRLIESGDRRDPRESLALVIKAYNEWFDGVKIQTLRWASQEAFPRFGKPSKHARRARGLKLTGGAS